MSIEVVGIKVRASCIMLGKLSTPELHSWTSLF
jgi:hypothetical protein